MQNPFRALAVSDDVLKKLIFILLLGAAIPAVHFENSRTATKVCVCGRKKDHTQASKTLKKAVNHLRFSGCKKWHH